MTNNEIDAVGLIFAQMGMSSGVLDEGLFSAVTMMVMATTFIATPLLRDLLSSSTREKPTEPGRKRGSGYGTIMGSIRSLSTWLAPRLVSLGYRAVIVALDCLDCDLASLVLLRYYPPSLRDVDCVKHRSYERAIMQRVEVNCPSNMGCCGSSLPIAMACKVVASARCSSMR